MHQTVNAHLSVDLSMLEWPSTRFPGVKVDPEDLNYAVVDADAAAAAMAAGAAPAEQVLLALAERKLSLAANLVADARMMDPGSLRLQILEADVATMSHDVDRAIELLRRIVSEFKAAPLDEAITRQHLGKAYFQAKDYRQAMVNFGKALHLRVAHGADAGLIYSSTVAFSRAQDLGDLR